jgi:ankyrin repeat protein
MKLTILLALASIPLSAASSLKSRDLRVAEAAMQGDRDAVKSLIKQKADVKAAQGDGMTALHWAAFKDDAELVKALLTAGADVKAVTRVEALTPLLIAAANGNAPIMDLLIKAGSDVNSIKTDGATVLMSAATSGSVGAVKLLLDRGASVNAVDGARGQTALMFAAALNRADVMRALIAHKADLNAASKVSKLVKMRYDEDGNPIGPAAATGAPPNPATTANRSGATAMGGMTALLYAARDNQFDAVKVLVEAGADVNIVSAGDRTSPIVMAIENGHYTVAKYLLDHGAKPNLANEFGLAALYAAIDAQWAPTGWAPNPITAQEKVTHLELMEALLKAGADPNQKLERKLWFRPLTHDQQWIGTAGSTPFWRAAAGTDVKAMRLLVKYGADPKIVSLQSDTPLMMAAGLGFAGQFTQTDPEGWIPSVKYCVELGLDVNAVDTQGYTALMGASWRGNNEIIQMLVDRGAKLDAKSKRGWNVTDMANAPSLRSSVPFPHPDTIAYLLKLGAPALTPHDTEPILGIIKSAPAAPKETPKK